MTQYDFIGDIHGYSGKLEELLLKLDYTKHSKGSREAFSSMTMEVRISSLRKQA